MTVEEAVALIAEAFADAETKAKAIKHDFRATKEAFETIRDAGHIGGLEAQSYTRGLDKLATGFEADLFGLHAMLTEKAKAASIDLPSIASGGR